MSEEAPRFRLFDIFPEPSSQVDGGFRVRVQNRASIAQYGEAGGRTCHEVFFGRDAPCAGCLLGDALRQDRVERWFLTRGEPGAPGTAYFEATAIPFAGPDGAPVSVIEVLRDVTTVFGVEVHLMRDTEALSARIGELQAHLDELTASRSAVLQTEKLATIGRLAAGIAHEVHTPLGTIVANLDLLRRRVERLAEVAGSATESPAALATFHEELPALTDLLDLHALAVERIRRIVGSLRLFAHLDRAHLERVDLHDGIEAALALLAHETRGRIEITCEFGEIPRVRCRPDALNQVYMNLLLNAIQAIDGRGRVRVVTHHMPASGARPEMVSVAVEDSGRGVPPEVQERIFDAGFTTKPRGVGTGLGLTVVRRTVADHGGTVMVDSSPLGGAVFTVLLPVDGPPADRA